MEGKLVFELVEQACSRSRGGGEGVLTAFVYADVGAIFLDLKSSLQAIFLSTKFYPIRFWDYAAQDPWLKYTS